MRTINQSAIAPEMMRIRVKLAASMLVCFRANRQSKEFPANATIAASVRMKIRVGVTDSLFEALTRLSRDLTDGKDEEEH
jgi:hypothetical protein